jgi:Ca2+-binding RTX toxin-like protein
VTLSGGRSAWQFTARPDAEGNAILAHHATLGDTLLREIEYVTFGNGAVARAGTLVGHAAPSRLTVSSTGAGWYEGAVVAKATATSPDALHWALSDTAGKLFAIDAWTGEISLRPGTSATSGQAYTVGVLAIDAWGNVTEKEVALTARESSGVARATTIGAGPDRLVLHISQDSWQGDAQFTVRVDGVQVDGTQTAHASHAAQQDDTLTVLGAWGSGQHRVTVTFLNDAWGGGGSDRNLYVDSASYNGVAQPGVSAALYSTGPASFTVTSFATPAPSAGGQLIRGTDGPDELRGTAGNDVVIGGWSNDGVTGAAGADIFVLAPGDGRDWIDDFTPGTDRLLLQGVTAASVWSEATSQWGVQGLAVHYGNRPGDAAFLAGVARLEPGDIQLA